MQGATAVFYAAKADQTEVVQYLHEMCDANLEAKDEKGQTPLMYSALENNYETVKWYDNLATNLPLLLLAVVIYVRTVLSSSPVTVISFSAIRQYIHHSSKFSYAININLLSTFR